MSDMVKLRDYVSIKTGKLDANAMVENAFYSFIHHTLNLNKTISPSFIT